MHYANISDNFKKQITYLVEEAVGDDIQQDVRRLKTRNSEPTRIWDLLNTKLIDQLDVETTQVATADRKIWRMVIIYEKSSECIFTFMREKRFAEIQRNRSKRECMHYLDLVAEYFNADLQPEEEQIKFSDCLEQHTFADESKLMEHVQDLLRDLSDDIDVVRHHVLVLFDASAYQLHSIRAVMITPALEIACEEDWSQFISHQESMIVDTVSDSEAPENQPNRGLSLKTKALNRKDQNIRKKDKSAENRSEHG